MKDGEADIFGQLRYQKNVNGTGLIKLDTTNPNSFKWIHDYGYIPGKTPILTAGTYVGNEYYAYETTFYSNVLMPEAISIVDVNTGKYTAKRKIVNSETEAPLIIDDMTYDPKTDRIFGVHYDTDKNVSDIYEIDRTTLEIRRVATTSKLLFTLSADNGFLYSVRMTARNCALCKIDESSIDENSLTCDIKDVSPASGTGVSMGNYSQSMEFDKTTHRLWWLAQTSDGNAYLVELDPNSGTAINKTLITSELQLLAMAIPYQYVADSAPSYPRLFTAKADDKGGLKAVLNWTMPSADYRNNELTELSGAKVYRNGELLSTLTSTQPGTDMSYTDTPANDGYYIYKVVPYNNAGDGVYKEYAAFVGEDLPGEPQQVTLTATTNGTAKVSWNAPEEGKQGGYFDKASLKYNVVRMPDNATIIEGTTLTSITDIVPESKGYSYIVTSVNKKGTGASATSNTLAIGPEDKVPFTSPLTSQADFERWTAVDNNGDNNTWSFYVPTQTTTYDRSDNAADDWLFSPALSFEKGKTYQVRYTYSTANWVSPGSMQPVMEKMKVWLCKNAAVDGNGTLIKSTGSFHTASNIFYYGKDLFQPTEDGAARVAFQACSDANCGQIYLKDVSVREYSKTDLSVQALTGSTLVNSSVEQTFTVDVKNEGSATVDNYRVLLLNADNNAVVGEAKGIRVDADATVEVPVNWTPGEVGTVKLIAKVELDGDTYPADNIQTTPTEVKISPADADRWLILNSDQTSGWRVPFFLLDPYAKCQSIFLEKEMQKKNIRITGMRFVYNGKNKDDYTFPAKIAIKPTSRDNMLDEDGAMAEFETGDFTTVFDDNITISGIEENKDMEIKFTTPYLYTGGNVCIMFECPIGNGYITEYNEHPEWHMTELPTGSTPRTAYCSGNDEESADVWGNLQIPYISISYVDDKGSSGVIALTGGNGVAVSQSGNKLSFGTVCDEAALYSTAGNLIANVKNVDHINLVNITNGVYVLRTTANGKTGSLKIVVNK